RARNVTGVQTCALPIWQLWMATGDLLHLCNAISSNVQQACILLLVQRLVLRLLQLSQQCDAGLDPRKRFAEPALYAAKRNDQPEIGRASCRERRQVKAS